MGWPVAPSSMQGRAQGAHEVRLVRDDDRQAQMLLQEGADAGIMGHPPGE